MTELRDEPPRSLEDPRDILLQQLSYYRATLLAKLDGLSPDQRSALGAQMNKRRRELTGPRAPELASSLARSMSTGTLVGIGSAMLAGAYLLTRHKYGDRLAAARNRFARAI